MKLVFIVVSAIACTPFLAFGDTLQVTQSIRSLVVPASTKTCVTNLVATTGGKVMVDISCGSERQLKEEMEYSKERPDLLPLIVEQMANNQFKTECSTIWANGFLGSGALLVLCIHQR